MAYISVSRGGRGRVSLKRTRLPLPKERDPIPPRLTCPFPGPPQPLLRRVLKGDWLPVFHSYFEKFWLVDCASENSNLRYVLDDDNKVQKHIGRELEPETTCEGPWERARGFRLEAIIWGFGFVH